jgi:large subunit ribosomal protein L3
VTVVAATTNVITQIRNPETDGYNAIQVGFGEIAGRKVTKPVAGQFAKAGTTPRKHLVEIRTADAASYTVGQELSVEAFAAGEAIDVTGTSKGKGFAGTMKRHGFAGVSASHGAHRNHRKPGSIGACATPGRVFKGVRMAGHMGTDTVTTQNLTVHAVDAEKGLILLKGAVPGPRGGLLVLRSAAKKTEK